MRLPKEFDFDVVRKPIANPMPRDGDEEKGNIGNSIGRKDGKGNGASEPPMDVTTVPFVGPMPQ